MVAQVLQHGAAELKATGLIPGHCVHIMMRAEYRSARYHGLMNTTYNLCRILTGISSVLINWLQLEQKHHSYPEK